MKAYFALLEGQFAALIQYRAAALAGMATQIFWGLIKSIVLTAFYAQVVTPPPISLTEAITFIWLGQALLALLPWNIDKTVKAQIKTGHVAYEMIRPLNLYGIWFCRSLAMRVIPTFLRCLPIFLFAGFFFGLSKPVSWFAGIHFIISLFFAAFLSTAMTTLVIISLFWTLSGEGILRLIPHLSLFFSGMMVPLPLFPEWMKPFLNVQPFRSLIDIPYRIYTGIIPSEDVDFWFQLAWICY